MKNNEPISNTLSEKSVDGSSVNDKNSKSNGRWTQQEHQQFMEGLKLFGKNWKKVEEFIGTRSGAQIRSHAQQFFNRLQKQYCQKKNKKNSQDTAAAAAESDEDSNESEKENISSLNSKFLQALNAADDVQKFTPIIESPPTVLPETQFKKKLETKNDEQNQFQQKSLLLQAPTPPPVIESTNQPTIRPLLQQKFLASLPQPVNNSESLSINNREPWVNPDSSYFNFFLSQICYSTLQQIRVPQLYDICGWGINSSKTKETEISSQQSTQIENKLISNDQTQHRKFGSNLQSQSHALNYNIPISVQNSSFHTTNSNTSFGRSNNQSFKICEQDAMKSLQLQNLRRKTSMDSNSNITKKIKTENINFDNNTPCHDENAKENIQKSNLNY